MIDDLKKILLKYEGLRLKPYTDTAGKLTIGIGRNLSDNGISTTEAYFMFGNDLTRTIKELEGYTWYLMQPENVQMALANMCFNLGLSKILDFTKMIRALINKDYTTAAKEALNSKWAKQVGQRATDIALMISEGK
jgi:lysozyme